MNGSALINGGKSVDYDDITTKRKTKTKLKVSRERREQRLANISETVYASASSLIGTRKLLKAATDGDLEQVARCLDSGTDSRTCDGKKRTALHIAVAKGCEEMVRLLLNRGADPNAQDALGNTALHLAACTNRVRIITLLLKAGTDIKCLDQRGKSPIHVASGKLRLLMAAGSLSSSRCEQLKAEVQQVIDMMSAYMESALGADENAISSGSLTSVRDRLQRSTTVGEVSEAVGDLLLSFSSFTLKDSCRQHEHDSHLPTEQDIRPQSHA